MRIALCVLTSGSVYPKVVLCWFFGSLVQRGPQIIVRKVVLVRDLRQSSSTLSTDDTDDTDGVNVDTAPFSSDFVWKHWVPSFPIEPENKK